MWILFFVLFGNGAPAEPAELNEAPRVLVLELPADLAQGSEAWFDVAYLASPNGETLFREPAERLWWLQNHAVLVLGSTGLPLPAEVTARASVWVHLIADDGSQHGPFELFPRRDGVALGFETAELAERLGKRLAGIDSSYLAQVAHFLVGNLTSLNVVGTSYSVSGFGTVINSSGNWVGGRLATLSGVSSVYVGQGAGAADDGSDNENVAVGVDAFFSNTTGDRNTIVGKQAGLAMSTGSSNTAIGYQAMFDATGSQNVAVGRQALASNNAYSNIAIGAYSLGDNTLGTYNTAIGDNALNNNQTGSYNTAVGGKSLESYEGSHSTAVGYYALKAATTGANNTAVGSQALMAVTTGYNNTAVGVDALASNLTGERNTALGNQALFAGTDGDNTAVGDRAIKSFLGGRTVALGGNSGTLNGDGDTSWTGLWNTFLGCYTGTTFTPLNNSTAIGDSTAVTASNQVRIGDTSVISIGGQVGWTTLSDGRFKRNIRENVPGLDFICQLRPVTYELDRGSVAKFLGGREESRKGAYDTTPQSGFIAQEVEAAVRKSGFAFSGIDAPSNDQTPYGLRYGQFVVPLVKAVQEQNALLRTQEDRIKALETQLAELQRLIQNR
jgi:hypothetical protein